MAYESTDVPVARSQDAIRKLIMLHKGFGLAVVSERDPSGQYPSQEGFQAKVMIEGKPYTIKIMANVRNSAGRFTEAQKLKILEQEERRIWRVLYYHLKSVFEAADTGVMEFRELMLPYIVMPNGKTISEVILPQLDAKLAGRPDRLLNAAEEEPEYIGQ
jgi:hypothetical protein